MPVAARDLIKHKKILYITHKFLDTTLVLAYNHVRIEGVSHKAIWKQDNGKGHRLSKGRNNQVVIAATARNHIGILVVQRLCSRCTKRTKSIIRSKRYAFSSQQEMKQPSNSNLGSE